MAVFKEPNGTYTVRCWYKDFRGERHQKAKRGFAKQKDAKAWERDFLSQEHTQIVTMSALLTAYKTHLDTQQAIGSLKTSTVHNKKNFIERYISDYYADAECSNVTTKVVNEWMAYLSKNYGYGDRMSSGTLRVIRNILSQIFEFGIKHYGLKNNPVQYSDLPAPYTNDKRVKHWDVETFNTFYASLNNETYRVLFNMLYWSGLRIGELLALTPADLQPDNTIAVVKSWTYINKEENFVSTPKNSPSKRAVMVPAFVFNQLKAYISTIEGIADTDRIFPFERSTPAHYLTYAIEHLGLPRASLHTMRHSYATNLLAVSKDYVSTSAQLGHANANTTFKVYAHTLKESAKQAVDQLADLHKDS